LHSVPIDTIIKSSTDLLSIAFQLERSELPSIKKSGAKLLLSIIKKYRKAPLIVEKLDEKEKGYDDSTCILE